MEMSGELSEQRGSDAAGVDDEDWRSAQDEGDNDSGREYIANLLVDEEAYRLDDTISSASTNETTKLPKAPPRPILRRDGSAPLPPQQPPPPTPPQQEENSNPTDSLSLAQLKRLVTDLPKIESTAYAYVYEDTRTFPEELSEWFQYTEENNHMLLSAKSTFDKKWLQFWAEDHKPDLEPNGWIDTSDSVRKRFVDDQLKDLSRLDLFTRVEKLEILAYIALGIWADTAGLPDTTTLPESEEGVSKSSSLVNTISELQIKWILKAADLLNVAGVEACLHELMIQRFENELTYDVANKQYVPSSDAEAVAVEEARRRELGNALTILYVMVEAGRHQIAAGQLGTIRQAFGKSNELFSYCVVANIYLSVALEPSLLSYLSQLIAKLRWDDVSNTPLTRTLLLFWKAILLLFGGTQQLDDSKMVLRDESERHDEEQGEGFITASPLDYHLFRQEITSKYPAYNPPPPLVPLELENNSILPPLPNHPSRHIGQESQVPGPGVGVNGSGRSIFHQPVHIATPAPSPPPSPAGPGGKGGKKQNYQTNQNFPFLYPPLDDTSNTVGGKGNAGLQDKLVGKKWEGSDVPASILEAGQLFASRMRMSRSTRQLWEVREDFMKFERGWEDTDKYSDARDNDLEKLEKLELADQNTRNSEHDSDGDLHMSEKPLAKETENEDVQSRLDAVEGFYKNSLPHLQSIVIVLLKVVLANVTALAAQTNNQNGIPPLFPLPEGRSDGNMSKPKLDLNLANQLNGIANGDPHGDEEAGHPALEDLNALRLREITSKAIAGILLMLLKWFKLSHILKYEYLCQLLLDSNYLPLALKLFAHQDVDRAVDQKNDLEDLDFFHFCQVHSKRPPTAAPPQPLSSSSSSSEDAAPPPISRHRRSPTSSSPPPSPGSPPSPQARPEVDELGYPTTALPNTPITNYAPRFFYTTITHLRLLQKITKRKAHRALLLVQYKSSTILRKALKIPQPDLRLYTLKLFKSQVPYCGRKWRQSNMRVITAIYLHCRPELRDEWLAGGDVDGVVEEAVPLEQAGRGLVHWWHLRGYRDVMEGEGGVGKSKGEKDSDEDDFFARELEKMGWGVEGGFNADEEEILGEDDVGVGIGIGTEWDGGPLQLEGW